MRFRILGPLEVWRDDRRLAVGGPQQRVLLAVLLLHAGRVVSSDHLIDCLWPERPPATARSLLQGCVAGLRRVLKDGDRQPLLTRSPGYLLDVRPGELDLDRFTDLERTAAGLATAGTQADLEQAATQLTEALGLWRGRPLDDIPLDAARAEADRLEERRLAAQEDLMEVELRLGRYAKLISELPLHIQAHPLRERPWAQLMLALYGAGRRADALDAYRRLRETLVDEIGLEPGPPVRQLQQDILAGTDALEGYLRGRRRPEPSTRQAETAHPAPAQLPAAPSAFTGRSRQLKALDELLSAPGTTLPVGLITGTAGVGKTALAVHWAHQVRERFPDGQLYLDLRGYASAPAVRPVEALAGLLRALGLPGNEIPADVEAAAGLYRTRVAGRRLLVVLDNADRVEQVRPLLPGSATCLVLVTSRDRLAGLVARDGAQPIELDVLEPAEATTLLGGLLGRERLAAEPAAAARLAEVCALLPLALRIAAADLAFQPRLRLSDQVAELTSGDRLSGLAVVGDEHSAVRVAFDLSYATLDPAARRLFRLLGSVPGPDVTAGAAAALADLPVPEAARVLERLADAHLIGQPAVGRYAFHDLLRLYAAERLAREDAEAERTAATARLYDWYLRTADAATRLLYPDKLRLRGVPPAPAGSGFGSRSEALAWLDQERANLVAASRHAAGEGPGRYAWLLADALRGYFQSRFVAVDWLIVANAARATAEAEGDLDAQAIAELTFADLRRLQGSYDAAIEHFGRAAELTRRSGWAEGESAVLGNLGIAHQWAGRTQAAAEYYRRALELDRRTGWVAGQHVKLGNLATAYQTLGRHAEALELLEEAMALSTDVNQGGQAITLSMLAESCRALDRLDEALEYLDRAVPMLREVGDKGSEALAIGLLATVHRDAGRLPDALAAARTAVAVAQEIGNARVEAEVLCTLGSVHQRLGQSELSVTSHERAIQLARAAETRHTELTAQVGLAEALVALGRSGQAQRTAESAATGAREDGYAIIEAEALVVWAEAESALGSAEAAAGHARQAVDLFQRCGDRTGLTRARQTLDRISEQAAPHPS